MYSKKTILSVLIAFVAGAGIFFLTKDPAPPKPIEYVDTEKGISFVYPPHYETRIHGGAGVTIGTTTAEGFKGIYNVAFVETPSQLAQDAVTLSLVCLQNDNVDSSCEIVQPQPFQTTSLLNGRVSYVKEEGLYRDEKNVPVLFKEVRGPFFTLPIVTSSATTTVLVYPVSLSLEDVDSIELRKIAESINKVN